MSLGHILETRDCVIGDRIAKRKCNSSELVRLVHGQISFGNQEDICVAASLFGSLVLECNNKVLDPEQLQVFELLAQCVLNSSSAAVVSACLRAMSNCFAMRTQPPPLTQQLCSRIISLVLNPCKEFNVLLQPDVVVNSLDEHVCHDVQACACRLLAASGTFLEFCSEQDAKSPLLKPSFKAALSSGPKFDAQSYSESCTKLAHLAFAPGTAVRLTAAILHALASAPRPLFVFALLQLKQQQCIDLLHAGHPSVRAALSRLLIVTLSSSASPSVVLNGLGPADAGRALCRLLAVSETVKHAVLVVAALLSRRPSEHLLHFFLSQRLIQALCRLMANPNMTSTLLEILFDCMAKLTSSFEEARRAVVNFCEEEEVLTGKLITVACSHINSCSSLLRHASASFLLSMSRSPVAIRSVFVDAAVVPILLSVLRGPYFDEAVQTEVIGESSVQISNTSSFAEYSTYSAVVMAIISNCLVPLSLFRHELISSDSLVSIICRCSTRSSDPELRTNSLCAASAILASQPSQELKLRIMTGLDLTRLLHTLQFGSASDQEFCLLALRNCADGCAEDVGALLTLLTSYCSPDIQCFKISYFSEFCLGTRSSIDGHCDVACTASLCARQRGQCMPSFPNNVDKCIFHDCPIAALDGHTTSCLEDCAQIRRCLAAIASFCSTASTACMEHLLLLLANIASGSSGRKCLVLEALPPSLMCVALASDEHSLRRVRFLCFVCCILHLTSLHAALWLLNILSSRVEPSTVHEQRLAYMSDHGFYDLARDSLSDVAAFSCVVKLLGDAGASGTEGAVRGDVGCLGGL